MANPAPLCTHIKTNGIVCGSPAVSETELCFHHSAIKTATANAGSGGSGVCGEFAPIPFVFPEDRASMQINFYLLLQAFNQHQIDLRAFKAMMSMLKSMAANLGKTGSLVEEASHQDGGPLKPASGLSGGHDQESRRNARKNSKKREEEFDDEEDDIFADLRHLPEKEFYAAVRERTQQIWAERAAEEQGRIGDRA